MKKLKLPRGVYEVTEEVYNHAAEMINAASADTKYEVSVEIENLIKSQDSTKVLGQITEFTCDCCGGTGETAHGKCRECNGVGSY